MTVHRDFCRAEENCPSESVLEFLDDKGEIARFDLRKCDEFAGQSLAFMQKEFGEMLKYCRVDMDEQSVHLHGLLYEIIKEKPTARFAEGKSLFRCTHHPLIQSHRDPETGKTGYERAQDAIGEWFEDPARSHLNIVRGEPRAAAFREAIEQGEQARAELQERIDAAPLIEKPIPPGSKNAQIIYAIRRLAETAEGKKLRKDAKQKMAIEMLVVGGFVSHEEQKEAKNRDLRDALLKGKEEEFGSVDDIISNPDALIAKLESQASDQKQRERHLEEKKKEQDARERKLQDWEILQKQRLLQIDQQAEEKLTQAEKKAERIRAGAELSAREKLRKADLLLEDAARKRDDAKNKRDEAETMLVVIEGMVDGHIRYGRTEKGEGFSIPADADKAQSEHIIGHIRRKPKAANRIGQRMGSMLGRLTKSFDDRADAAMEWIRRREAEFAQAYGRLSEFVKALAFERNEEKARKIANKLGVLVGLNSIYNALNHGKTWKRDEEER
nr:hypothetical protein [uncultured Cohaesibacter sp.]